MNYPPAQIHPLLKPYIKNIEIIDSGQLLTSYKVYPNLYVVMGFQYQGRITLLTDNHENTLLNPSGITGLLKTYRTFQAVNHSTKTILIKFYPWGVPALFNESANVLTEQSCGLSDLIKEQEVRIIEEKIQAAKQPNEMVSIIQEHFINLISAKNKTPLLQQRIINIAQQLMVNPKITLEELARGHGYSMRTLERYFQTIIGLSPKRFMLTARFQKVLNKLQAGDKWETIAEQLNYYDQSHFINEFKQFTGTTPQQFLLDKI